jgi:hypothetical protein
MQLNDEINKLQYAVVIEGKIVYKSSLQLSAENYRAALPENQRNKATVVAATDEGKQALFG